MHHQYYWLSRRDGVSFSVAVHCTSKGKRGFFSKYLRFQLVHCNPLFFLLLVCLCACLMCVCRIGLKMIIIITVVIVIIIIIIIIILTDDNDYTFLFHDKVRNSNKLLTHSLINENPPCKKLAAKIPKGVSCLLFLLCKYIVTHTQHVPLGIPVLC